MVVGSRDTGLVMGIREAPLSPVGTTAACTLGSSKATRENSSVKLHSEIMLQCRSLAEFRSYLIQGQHVM